MLHRPKEVFMHYGVVMFPTEYAMAPDELARALEERGFESVWFPEHTHIPASRRSPWPGGGDLPRDYWSSYDPFVALMAAAAATKRLKLGTGICLVIERDPITMAKEVATLDRLSGGRVLFGIGGGWNQAEMANHGTQWKTRRPPADGRACRDLLRPTEEAGTGRARRGRGRARDLRRAVGNPRRRSSEARRVRRRHAQLTTRVHDKRPASQTRFAVAGLFVGRS